MIHLNDPQQKKNATFSKTEVYFWFLVQFSTSQRFSSNILTKVLRQQQLQQKGIQALCLISSSPLSQNKSRSKELRKNLPKLGGTLVARTNRGTLLARVAFSTLSVDAFYVKKFSWNKIVQFYLRITVIHMNWSRSGRPPIRCTLSGHNSWIDRFLFSLRSPWETVVWGWSNALMLNKEMCKLENVFKETHISVWVWVAVQII